MAALTSSCGSFPTTPCGVHPLIDVTPLLKPSAAAPFNAAVQQMGAALREVGWFYAAGVPMLPPDYIRGIYAYLGKAHALSAAEKYKYRQRGGLGSYSGPDVGEPGPSHPPPGSPPPRVGTAV
jgi:isopenicillin N synthase-like dioxygenase